MLNPVFWLRPCSALILLWLLLPACQALPAQEKLELSGFARLVGGYLDSQDKTEFSGYQDNISAQQQSLLALQPSYHVTPGLTLTGQFVAHSNSERHSGTEWLYLSYRAGQHWHIRAGKLRMPFFSYSDSIDIGYSYPWITAPAQVYNNYLFSTFNGISTSYRYAARSYALDLEGYYGYFDGDIFSAGSRVDVEARVNHLTGVVMSLSSHNLQLRLSYHQGQNDTELPELQPLQQGLIQAGYPQQASDFNSDGTIRILQAALSYDSLNTFYKAEWVKTRTELELTPKFTGYYLTAGVHTGDWSSHLTYAGSAYGKVTADPALQDASNDPQHPLFLLANGYYQVFNSIPDGSMDSYTLGTRWNFTLNMAFKAEVSYLQENQPRSGFFAGGNSGLYDPDYDNQKRRATLYQLGWEWVF